MYNHYPFERLAVLNHERYIELVREADQYRLLGHLNAKPKWSNLLHKVIELFTLKTLRVHHSISGRI